MENIIDEEKKAFEYKFRKTFEELNVLFDKVKEIKSNIENQIMLCYKTNKEETNNLISYHNNFLYNELIEKLISRSITLSCYRNVISECKIKDMEKMLELKINKDEINIEYTNGHNRLRYIDWYENGMLCENTIIQDNTNLKINILDVKNIIEKK